MYYAFRRWSATARYYVASPYLRCAEQSHNFNTYGVTPYEALRGANGPYLWRLEPLEPELLRVRQAFLAGLQLRNFILSALSLYTTEESFLCYLVPRCGREQTTSVQIVLHALATRNTASPWGLAETARLLTGHLQEADYERPGLLAEAARCFNRQHWEAR
jgi:hypothetical protein